MGICLERIFLFKWNLYCNNVESFMGLKFNRTLLQTFFCFQRFLFCFELCMKLEFWLCRANWNAWELSRWFDQMISIVFSWLPKCCDCNAWKLFLLVRCWYTWNILPNVDCQKWRDYRHTGCSNIGLKAIELRRLGSHISFWPFWLVKKRFFFILADLSGRPYGRISSVQIHFFGAIPTKVM